MIKRFLLLSDIHASSDDPSAWNAPSYVSSVSAVGSGGVEPLGDLLRLMNENDISPDFVLCAGDITNRAHPASLSYAWARLQDLAEKLGAKLIATVGNHDLDSRYKDNKFDPKGYAMALRPPLPVEDRNNYLEYWAENFTALQLDGLNIVVLNTAAYHGQGAEAAKEMEYGRISELTIALLKNRLTTLPEAKVNVLLCHHHPLKGDGGDSDTVGPTRGGEPLVEVLDDSNRPWIIIHGHKHVPDLFYGHGSGNSPVVMACASFSAQVNSDAQNKNPNQVHLLTCDPDAASDHGMVSAGTVRSWTWLPGVGWRPAQDQHGLPHQSGFGFRGDTGALVKSVDEYLLAANKQRVAWEEATSKVVALRHLPPKDFKRFQAQLEGAGLTILSDRDGQPAQLGRLANA